MSTPDQPSNGGIKKVLLIEDDIVTQMTIARIVKGAGYVLITAIDAADALKALRMDRPDVILADINLSSRASGPVLDGFNVLDWLNYHYPEHHTRCIIVSITEPEKLRQRATDIGAFALLRKPVAKDLLLTEIGRAIGGPSALPAADSARPG
jgi:CheY-like chemotaxis protein